MTEVALAPKTSFKMPVDTDYAPYGGDESPQLPTDSPGSVVLKKQDLSKILEAMDEAAEVLSIQGPKHADLTKKLKRMILQHCDGVQYSKASFGGGKKAVHKPGYSLGQAVEVRYVVDDNVGWSEAKIVPGSGGGLYSVEFPNGDIWDRIPGEDLRPCETFHGNMLNMPKSLGGSKTRKSAWNLATTNEHVMYNGWAWMQDSSDWNLSRKKTKTWNMIIGTKFYFGDVPQTEDWTVRDLLFASITVRPDSKGITVSNEEFNYNFTVSFENDYEFKVWTKQFETAVLRAEKKPDYTSIVALENQLQGMLKRPVLPMFDPNALSEKTQTTIMAGAVVCATGTSWLGGKDWKRRWVTLHTNWMCIRPEKASPAGLVVIPFRETKCFEKPLPGHPMTLEISGPFITPHYVAFDTKETFDEWRKAIISAVFVSNPEDSPTARVTEETETEHRGVS
ncbi:hypothetical protein DIPPA_35393 [Diplonema papillatum]|nr:hypothetical protein DIPPA_35393 [Diplonema papillatum]|eukprot:gene7871-12092_t